METQHQAGPSNTSNRGQDPLETEGGVKAKQDLGRHNKTEPKQDKKTEDKTARHPSTVTRTSLERITKNPGHRMQHRHNPCHRVNEREQNSTMHNPPAEERSGNYKTTQLYTDQTEMDPFN